MSLLLKIVLLVLANLHSILSLALLLFVLSPFATWACAGKHEVLCAARVSVWRLQHVFPETIAYTVQAFLLGAACTNLCAVVIGVARVYKEVVAVFNAVTFVLGVIPWALVLGFRDEAKGKVGSAMMVSIVASFVHMIAASLSLTAIFMPDDEARTAAKQALDLEDVDGQKVTASLLASKPHDDTTMTKYIRALEGAAIVALVTAGVTVDGLRSIDQTDDIALGASGCQFAVLLLAADVLLVSTLIVQRTIDIRKASIVAASLALCGWITGIVGCSLTAVAMGSFNTTATFALLSVLSSFIVFVVGIYLGVHFP